MEKLDILIWVVSGGFAIMFGLMLTMWNNLNNRMDKLSEKVEDVDRRLCRIEGSLSVHGHCLFNQSKPDQAAQ